jgi:hypothetical protein
MKLHENAELFQNYIALASQEEEIDEAIVVKDYFVTLALKKLYHVNEHLIFYHDCNKAPEILAVLYAKIHIFVSRMALKIGYRFMIPLQNVAVTCKPTTTYHNGFNSIFECMVKDRGFAFAVTLVYLGTNKVFKAKTVFIVNG